MIRFALPIVLLFIASCAPAQRQVVSQLIPERPSTLLRKLALDVPSDIARLPALGAGRAATGMIAAAPAFLEAAQSMPDSARALDCLTAAIYYEARSESIDGQRAVAQVVLNRVRDRAFPASVCGVVYQGSTRRTGCQFSFTCDGSMLRPRNPASWARSALVAGAALAGEVYAPVGSATHYHTTAISPWWAPSLSKLVTVGAHVFYRWPNLMERALAFRQNYSGYEPVVASQAFDSSVTVAGGGGAGGYATETVQGVTIHRAGLVAAPPAPSASSEAPVAAAPALRPASIMAFGVRVHHGAEAPGRNASGVRIHHGTPAATAEADDQLSRSPMPIEARAASASLETTG